MSEGKNLKIKKARAWAADTQGPRQPAWEERGTRVGWWRKENIRKDNPCCLLSNLIVAGAGDKCIWF